MGEQILYSITAHVNIPNMMIINISKALVIIKKEKLNVCTTSTDEQSNKLCKEKTKTENNE